jgi:hypothetical protein
VQLAAVDAKEQSAATVQTRASLAGLSDVVSVHCGRIEEFERHFDVALGLHVCGLGTDAVLAAARARRAMFIVSPCCVGKAALRGRLIEPRSRLLRTRLVAGQYELLARAADFAGGGGVDGYDDKTDAGALPRAAKTAVESDRGAAAAEDGYDVRLVEMRGGTRAVGIKVDVLVGWPRETTPAVRDALVGLFSAPSPHSPAAQVLLGMTA